MIVPPVGTYTPVSPVSPVAPVSPAKPKSTEKTSRDGRRASNNPARSAAAMASHSTRAALDDMKLGG